MINDLLTLENSTHTPSKAYFEWQPSLFDKPDTALLRMEFERQRQVHEKTRKALFARNEFLYKELQTISAVVSDLAEAYAELMRTAKH